MSVVFLSDTLPELPVFFHRYITAATTSISYTYAATGGNITAGQGTHQITVQWNNGVAGTVSVVQTTD